MAPPVSGLPKKVRWWRAQQPSRGCRANNVPPSDVTTLRRMPPRAYAGKIYGDTSTQPELAHLPHCPPVRPSSRPVSCILTPSPDAAGCSLFALTQSAQRLLSSSHPPCGKTQGPDVGIRIHRVGRSRDESPTLDRRSVLVAPSRHGPYSLAGPALVVRVDVGHELLAFYGRWPAFAGTTAKSSPSSPWRSSTLRRRLRRGRRSSACP